MIRHTTTNGDETRAESDDAVTMLQADHATMRRLSYAGAPRAEPGLVAIRDSRMSHWHLAYTPEGEWP